MWYGMAMVEINLVAITNLMVTYQFHHSCML